MRELPLHDTQATRERADAARNRRRILVAAGRLVAEHGIANVSMDDIAREANVGTGTLYRRFGDRAGLALALLDDHERAFQDAVIAGQPPLGPGAPAAERLKAFGDVYVEVLERHADILAVAAPPGRGAPGPHQFYSAHLAILLREAAPHVDPEFTAQALLATLAPEWFVRARRGMEWPLERIRDGWQGLVDALTRQPA